MVKYYFPMINKNFSEINPMDVGWEKCEPSYAFGPYIREHYLIHYVRSGKGMLYNERGEFPVKRGQIFIIRPGEVATYRADEKDPWHYIWIGFSGTLAQKLDKLQGDVFDYNDDTFIRLTSAGDYNNTREEYVAGLTFEIMSNILNNPDRNPKYAKQAVNYINVNYMNDITVEEIAEVVGLNRRYLGRIFKKAVGMTIQEYLVHTRLSHGAEYLKIGESVTDAAMLSGYTDVFNFSKMFKKHFGVSPREYKNNL